MKAGTSALRGVIASGVASAPREPARGADATPLAIAPRHVSGGAGAGVASLRESRSPVVQQEEQSETEQERGAEGGEAVNRPRPGGGARFRRRLLRQRRDRRGRNRKRAHRDGGR